MHENRGADAPPAREGLDWVEPCRLIATIGVVIIHACGLLLAPYGPLDLGRWLRAGNLLDSLTRCSVPLFMMLTGALLLRPGVAPGGVGEILRRGARVFVPLVAWSGLYAYFHFRMDDVAIDPVEWLRQPAMYHLWYAYVLLGVYLALPLLRVVATLLHQRGDLAAWFFGVWIAGGFALAYFPGWLVALLQPGMMVGYTGFFLLGAWLVHGPRLRLPWPVLAAVFALAVGVTFVLTVRLSETANTLDQSAYQYFSPNVVLMSAAALLLCMRLRLPRALVRLRLGELTFFAYLMHPLLLDLLRRSELLAGWVLRWPASLVIVAVSLAALAASLVVAAVIRRIPGGARLLG